MKELLQKLREKYPGAQLIIHPDDSGVILSQAFTTLFVFDSVDELIAHLEAK